MNFAVGRENMSKKMKESHGRRKSEVEDKSGEVK